MDEETDKLIQRLIANAKKIQMAQYGELEELFNYTKTHLFPKNVAELAEAFGMMAVKLEAREYDLERKIKDIEEASEKLRISKEKLEEYSRTLEQKVEERTAEIARLASVDDLTGLLNRSEVLRMMHYELSKRGVTDLSLVFFDIDHFKDVNDTYGHAAGDQVLLIVGKTVRESVRKSDLAGRYGGEEFLIVLPSSEGRQASVVAERIRMGLAVRPFSFGGVELNITASFGIISLADNEQYITQQLGVSSVGEIFNPRRETAAGGSTDLTNRLFELLLRLSDQALYKAKKSSCLSCGFESEKADDFTDSRCPHCGGSDIEKGRNRVKTFMNGRYM